MIETARVYAEKRRLVLPLLIALAINVLFYAIVVYPRTSSAGALERRARTAAQARAAAQKEVQAADAMRTGQERAARQLAHFYENILPKGQEGARRITYRRLAALADETNLDYDRRTITTESVRESALERMEVTMALEGEYRDVRRFIHRLETSPEFIVIDDISLQQGQPNEPLTLTLKLSTYYKAAE